MVKDVNLRRVDLILPVAMVRGSNVSNSKQFEASYDYENIRKKRSWQHRVRDASR